MSTETSPFMALAPKPDPDLEGEAKLYQYPIIHRECSRGWAVVKTYIGNVKSQIEYRTSPRIADETARDLLARMEAQLKARVEPLMPTA